MTSRRQSYSSGVAQPVFPNLFSQTTFIARRKQFVSDSSAPQPMSARANASRAIAPACDHDNSVVVVVGRSRVGMSCLPVLPPTTAAMTIAATTAMPIAITNYVDGGIAPVSQMPQ